MEYKSNDIDTLCSELKKRIVEFEYKENNSIIRVKGTLVDEYLPEKLPDRIIFEKEVINILMEIKHISTIGEYARENGLKFVRLENNNYVFEPLIKEKDFESDNTICYYNVEKDSYEYFNKDNFVGLID